MNESDIARWTRKAEQQGFATWREAMNAYRRERYALTRMIRPKPNEIFHKPTDDRDELRRRAMIMARFTRKAEENGAKDAVRAYRDYNRDLARKNHERKAYLREKFFRARAAEYGLPEDEWREARKIYHREIDKRRRAMNAGFSREEISDAIARCEIQCAADVRNHEKPEKIMKEREAIAKLRQMLERAEKAQK